MLLVEDDEDQREMARTWLRGVFPKISITMAGSLAAATSALDHNRFDVVLTDLGLPDSSPDETLALLQGHARQAPILVLTGHGEERVAMRAMRSGAEDCLVKGHMTAERLRRAVVQARERHSRHRQLAERAHHDALTGLLNRQAFHQQVDQTHQRAARYDEGIALLFIDLDEFKDVNDRYGHEAGDVVLQTSAERILSCVRHTDHVGRLGGDEFAVLLDRISDAGLEEVLERIQACVREPVNLGDATVRISASIGVAQTDATRESLSALFRHADAAMYQAKTQGRNRFRRFDSQLHRQLHDQRETLHSLRAAVRERQFELHYQPVFEAQSGRFDSVEALVRWRHPERGVLGPGHFIDDLERDEAMLELGAEVFREVCEVVAARRDRGRPLTASVNLCQKEFDAPSFVERLEHVLRATGAEARDIQFEVTEGMLTTNPERAQNILQVLSDRGFKIALDNFGTGFSSLAHLRTLPTSTLKIDRQFISGGESAGTDEAAVTAVVQLAHALGHRVVAEGVETAEQLQQVRRAGCDGWQGFLGSHPVPLDQLLQHWLST